MHPIHLADSTQAVTAAASAPACLVEQMLPGGFIRAFAESGRYKPPTSDGV